MRHLLLFSLLLISLNTLAQSMVVRDYGIAGSDDVWKKAKTDQLPDELLGPFEKLSSSNELFIVCFRNCNISQSVQDKWSSLEQSNVYFWLGRYFEFLQEHFLFRPSQRLKVYTDRSMLDEMGEKKLTNNAFFNPKDNTLSFLPAKNKVMKKLFGKDLNRSGYDPSVIAHEASHFFFQQLFPLPMNAEIQGLNEGFADYMANIMLENPKVGLIMMRGKAARDSSSFYKRNGTLKTYAPKMDSHDLGERVSLALWKSRELAKDKHEFDRMVIDTVIELSRNPYSTIHDFKSMILERLKVFLPVHGFGEAEVIWENIFPGMPAIIAKRDFLDHGPRGRNSVGFSISQTRTRDYAREMGLPQHEGLEFTLIRTEALGPYQKAILIGMQKSKTTHPYWIVIDTIRANVLGIYKISGELVTDPDELSSLYRISSMLSQSVQYFSDFIKKMRAFSGLWKDEGELKSAYKVKFKEIRQVSLSYNGIYVTGKVLSMDLKQKFLAKLLSDIPEIERLSVYTLPVKSENPGIPEIEGELVTGYKVRLKGGSSMEVRINKTGSRE